MAALDKVDSVLDKLDRLDDWVRDQLPQSWIMDVPEQRESPARDNGWGAVNTAGIVIKALILLVVAAIWLFTHAAWWEALLGTVGCLVGGALLSVYVREVLRHR